MRFYLWSINKLALCLGLMGVMGMVMLCSTSAQAGEKDDFLDDVFSLSDFPLYGESCEVQEKSLTEMVALSKICQADTDCVPVKYNLDGCGCTSYANKHRYVRSIEAKTQQFLEQCGPLGGDQPCACGREVAQRCYWGKCVPKRCDYRVTYEAGECVCRPGSTAKYDRILQDDGTMKETIFCRPESYMLDFSKTSK